MKKILSLTGIALSLLATSILSSCEKTESDSDFVFTHTSWEGKTDHDVVTGSLLISFMTGDNGVIKEEVQDGNGAKRTLYSVFTYEVENGNGTLHIGEQYSFCNNKLVGKTISGSDAHFTLGKNSNTLEFNEGEGIHDFLQTDFLPISLPVTDSQESEESEIVLNYNMLQGNWGTMSGWQLWTDTSFSFYKESGQSQPLFANVFIRKYDIIFSNWWIANNDTRLYPEIGTPANTVVYYDNSKDRNVKYYLVFHKYLEDLKVYDVTLEDASHNHIASDYIEKK